MRTRFCVSSISSVRFTACTASCRRLFRLWPVMTGPCKWSLQHSCRALPLAEKVTVGAVAVGRLRVKDASHDRTREDVGGGRRSEEHTSELQSRGHLVCRLLLEKKNKPSSTHD